MAAAIVHGTKRIENRPRNLPKAMRGVPTVVAVHAGRGWDDAYWDTLCRIDGRPNESPPKCEPYVARAQDLGFVGLMLLTGRVWTHRDVHDYSTSGPQRDNNDYDVVREYAVDGYA